ncbi:MAG: YicC family protein [Acidobacteria bacterium]|nr:YicC family protein [Acidobacteriota bacterium]MCB9397574.1 YicC family protein [Acidobacteriota bacterium]
MLTSMTGYGEASQETAQIRVGFRIRAVNHKGLDLQLRLPMELAYLESSLRAHVTDHVKRGRIDIYSEIEMRDPQWMPKTEVSRPRILQLMETAQILKQEYQVQGELDVNSVLRLSDLVSSQKVGFALPAEGDTLICQTLDQAVLALIESRRREGACLHQALIELLNQVAEHVIELEKVAQERPEEIQNQLRKKMESLLSEYPLDDARLYQEVLYHVDRTDITEELTRLHTHIQQFRAHLEAPDASMGKVLEFVTQEMQREVTTIGNKARMSELADKVVKLKADLEKIREQLLNIE